MKVIVGILIGPLLIAGALGIVLWAGAYNVSATNPASRVEVRLATLAVKQAIRKRADGSVTNPFSTPQDIQQGLAAYMQNCVDCHGARGLEESGVGKGLNPAAPDLTLSFVRQMRDGELYWIVSNGIRMTGMPAFSPTHTPDEIWKIVAFVRHMPEMTPGEQQALKTSRARCAADRLGAETDGAVQQTAR